MSFGPAKVVGLIPISTKQLVLMNPPFAETVMSSVSTTYDLFVSQCVPTRCCFKTVIRNLLKRTSRVNRHAANLLSFEMAFCLFLFSGVFKSHPLLKGLPIDLTILMAIITGLYAIWLLYSGRVSVRPVSLLLVGTFGLFVGWALLSLWWGEMDNYTLNKAIRLPTVTLWALVGSAVVISSSPRRIQRFAGSLIVLAGLVVADLAYRYATIGDLWSTPPFHSGSYLLPSTLLGAGLVSALTLFSKYKSRSWIFVASSLCAVYLVSLLLPGGRGPLLASIGATGIYCLLTFVRPKSHTIIRIPSWIGYVSIMSIAGAVAVVLVARDSVHTLSRLLVLLDGGGGSAHTRLDLYQHAANLFSDNILIGVGLGDFALSAEANWPHNLLLEVGAELGLVGLFLLGFVAYTSIRYWSKLRNSPTNIYALSICIYFAALSLLTGDINSNRFFFMAIGLLIISDQKGVVAHTTSKR